MEKQFLVFRCKSTKNRRIVETLASQKEKKNLDCSSPSAYDFHMQKTPCLITFFYIYYFRKIKKEINYQFKVINSNFSVL